MEGEDIDDILDGPEIPLTLKDKKFLLEDTSSEILDYEESESGSLAGPSGSRVAVSSLGESEPKIRINSDEEDSDELVIDESVNFSDDDKEDVVLSESKSPIEVVPTPTTENGLQRRTLGRGRARLRRPRRPKRPQKIVPSNRPNPLIFESLHLSSCPNPKLFQFPPAKSEIKADDVDEQPVKTITNDRFRPKTESESDDDDEIQVVEIQIKTKGQVLVPVKKEEEKEKDYDRGVKIHSTHIPLNDRIEQANEDKYFEIGAQQPIIPPDALKGNINRKKFKNLKRKINRECHKGGAKRMRLDGDEKQKVKIAVGNLPLRWLEQDYVKTLAEAYGPDGETLNTVTLDSENMSCVIEFQDENYALQCFENLYNRKVFDNVLTVSMPF